MKKNLLFVKVISLVLAVVFSLSLTAATAEGGDDLLDTIKERGTLIVGTEGTWSPIYLP